MRLRMKPKIPISIRQQVIKQWLQGISRDQIAKNNGIGSGTVSTIIKECKRNDIPDIDLLREVALVLTNEDLDLAVFADSIRIKKKMDEMDLSEDLVESFIENINIHCFKRGLTAEEFVDIIDNTIALSEKLGIPVDHLPHHITQQKLELEKVERKTEDAEIKLLQVLDHYNVTMNDLEEYKKNRPSINRIKQLEGQIEKTKRERDYYAQQLRNEQIDKAKFVQFWRMSS
jgi:transcriptional regulator with XRE-family HTH domain